MQGRIRMHFLEIICTDIVFKLCRGRSQRGATVPMHLRGSAGAGAWAPAPAPADRYPEDFLLACAGSP